MADTLASGASARKGVEVQILSWALQTNARDGAGSKTGFCFDSTYLALGVGCWANTLAQFTQHFNTFNIFSRSIFLWRTASATLDTSKGV